MHLGFGIWAPCMGPWDPWPKILDLGPMHGPLGPLALKKILYFKETGMTFYMN